MGMAFFRVKPETTLAVVLGAQQWPRFSSVTSSPIFGNSAGEFRHYLRDPAGLALPEENVKDLFDDERSPLDILEEIKQFLRTHSAAKDLVLYYVGHGSPVGSPNDYRLLLRYSDLTTPDATTLAMSHLAEALRDPARGMRWYIILDACFAAKAVYALQSPNGVAVFCAANQQVEAKAPEGVRLTMFTGALLEVLRKGDPETGEPWLSLNRVAALTKKYATATWGELAVRPEVHCPDQRGEIELPNIPFFPNVAVVLPGGGGEYVSPWTADLETGTRVLARRLDDAPSAADHWCLAVMLARQGHVEEAARHLQGGDLLAPGEPPPERFLYGGYLAFRGDNLDGAETAFRAFLAADAPRPQDLAVAYDLLGRVLTLRSNPDAAMDAYSSACAVKEQIDDLAGKSITLGNLGRLALFLGRYREAVSHFRENLKLIGSLGAQEQRGIVRNNLAEALLALGGSAEPQELLGAARQDLASSARDRGFADLLLAELYLAHDRLAEGASALEKGRGWLERASDQDGLALADEVEGLIALARGWAMTARRRFREFDAVAPQRAGTLYHTYRLRRRAFYAAQVGDYPSAQEFLAVTKKIALAKSLPIVAAVERDLAAFKGMASGNEPPADHEEMWALFWRRRLPRPLARAMPVATQELMPLFTFAEEFMNFSLLATAALLEDTGDRPAFQQRRTLGQTLGVLREAVNLLPLRQKPCPLPEAEAILGDLARLVQLRNGYVHGSDRSAQSASELRQLFAKVVRYAGRTFRLQYRDNSTNTERIIHGITNQLPESGKLELEAGGQLIDLTPFMRIIQGQVAYRDVESGDDRWVLEDGRILQ
jgi:hypothetical protein